MGDRPTRKVNIRVFHYDEHDITTHCPRCDKILHETSYSILLTDGPQRHIFLSDTTVLCCGVEITVPLGFEDEKSARRAQEKIAKTVRRDGNLGRYLLQALPEGPTKH